MSDDRTIKDAAWAAYCNTPTARDCGRSKVDAAVEAALQTQHQLKLAHMHEKLKVAEDAFQRQRAGKDPFGEIEKAVAQLEDILNISGQN